MPGVLVAVFLIASLILVHFSMRSSPMPAHRPLDVDTGLPFPELAQASTVFSLTALFGAYLGIYFLLGLPALAGCACGTVMGLLLIRTWILGHGSASFEQFLSDMLTGPRTNAVVFAVTVCGIQCGYATSELLILRELTHAVIGVRTEQAILMSVGVGTIGYFYILFGGYRALFRTDVLQFMLIAIMGLVLAFGIAHPSVPVSWQTLLPRPGYWALPGAPRQATLLGYHFAVGTIMGLGLLVASPDAWKRVFVVVQRRRARLVALVFAGTLPFVLLIPLAAVTRRLPDGPVAASQMFSGLLTSNATFVAALLGLLASFLSAFNSALLGAVHVGLLFARRTEPVQRELSRFYWLIVTALITIFLLFAGLARNGNPYLVANVLIGGYAIVGGTQVATAARPAAVRAGALLWLFVLAGVAWIMYFMTTLGLPSVPTTYEVNTVPGGAALFVLVAIAAFIIARSSPRVLARENR